MGSTLDMPGSSVGLKRELGLFSAINLILAVMIGSGIFVSPASALKYSGSVGMCVIVWVVCGIISLLGALAFAELGTVVPRSGAEYAYFMDSFAPLHRFWGPLPAFLYSWLMVVIIRPAEIAIIVMTFSEYATQPVLDYLNIVDVELGDRAKRAIGLVALGLITYINSSSVKLYVILQNTLGVFKVLACIIIIGCGVFEIYIGNTANLSKGFEGTLWHPKHLALAFYSGLWAYDGWSAVTTVTEEIQKPEKNIPRSIIISVPIVTALYVLMNVSYMTVLSIPEMIHSTAVAVTFGERILGPFSIVIPIGVALSTFGCALSVQFGVTRLCYVAGQDGFMLEAFSYVHYKNLTPTPAVVVQGLIAFLFIIVGNILELIEFASFLIWISYGTAMVALIVLRRTKNDIKRPYKVPLWIPVFILLVAVYLTIVPIVMEPDLMYLSALVFALMGLPVYYYFVYKQQRPKKFMDGVTYFLQVLFEAVPPQ